ncbi:MAG: anthranilate synthase component I [Pseudomonadota bacterium]
MSLSPGFDVFKQNYDAGRAQTVWTRRISDLDTPVSAYLKLARDRADTFLFESVVGGEVLGRYSIIGRQPDAVWRLNGGAAEISRKSGAPGTFQACAEPALDALRAFLNESEIDLPADLPPMAAGVFGYMGYDAVRLMERLPAPNPDALQVPDAIFIRPTMMAIFDSIRQEIVLVSPVRSEAGVDAAEAYGQAEERLQAAARDLDAPYTEPTGAGAAEAADLALEPQSNTTPERYCEMVAKAKAYIEAGDIFQAVLSQRFSTPFPAPPIALYRALRRTNPSPFLFFLNFEDFALVGSSPELLVRVRGREVTVRPIAGTRPRGATPAEDLELEQDLLADEKELAEHLMLLDLGRNDVGRVAKTGTVRPTDEFIVERYSHVMHIVSNVVGELKDDVDIVAALAAGFPAGTVSGAPKIRAMEIIDELEADKRGPYAGVVGYFSAGGDMDNCIALRTAVIKDGVMHVQAGAGVVADSDPQSEHQECVNKAKALFAAAREGLSLLGANR